MISVVSTPRTCPLTEMKKEKKKKKKKKKNNNNNRSKDALFGAGFSVSRRCHPSRRNDSMFLSK